MKKEEKKEENIIPVFASAFFSISHDGEFHQLLQYDYFDAEEYYATLSDEDISKEIKKLWLNMQGYLEEETNRVNGEIVSPKVEFCDIQYRGSFKYPFVIWIITFQGNFQKGINLYETKTDEETLEYDCSALWQFPQRTKILQIDTKLYYDILDTRIILWGDKHMKIGGYERIQFRFI
ncbi:MAG TPA: hypothetical protein VMV49_07215 [Candidatus Deferrimicrobium sp.]|nr:hypothetical protein [Candidatus Deferrimicrobium sp.]